MSSGDSKNIVILAFALIIVVAIDGFLAYRYYGALAQPPGTSADGITAVGVAEKTDSAFERPETTGDTTVESGGSDESSFVQRAEPENIFDNSTYINDPRINGEPDAVLLVKSPRSGDKGDYAHSIGVWYDASLAQWAIFNQDIDPMQEASAFDVTIARGSSRAADEYEAIFVHQATAANISDNATYVDDPSVNGNPDAKLSITPNWNPGAKGGTYDDHPVSINYDPDTRSWMILNKDDAKMPDGAAFNVAVS